MSSLSDPIGDFVTRMRNAQHARRTSCSAPWSGIKQKMCELLKREGWIQDFEVVGEAPKQELEITFKKDKPALELKRVSTPGRRMYTGAEDLKRVLHGFGMAIITTSEGLLTDREAKKRKIGGEIICTIS